MSDQALDQYLAMLDRHAEEDGQEEPRPRCGCIPVYGLFDHEEGCPNCIQIDELKPEVSR